MESPPRPTLTLDDLPAWMRPRRRQVDMGLLGTLLLCCVIAFPWLTRPGLPNSLNAQAEVARIAEMADSLEQGTLYPRWAAHFHFGYGSPIFNYLAPLPHYLGGLLMILTEASPVSSLKTLIIACIFLAGVGMFLFARHRWGETAGILAALMYLLAPQIIYRHYLEVDLAVLMTAGLFPCFLWSLDQNLRVGDSRDIVVLGLFTALLMMASNLLSPILLIMGCLWGLWTAFIEGERAGSAARGITLGIGLSALYWLPAVTEWQAVHWVSFDNQLHRLNLSEVMQMPLYPAERLFNPFPANQLGMAVWLFALASIAALAYQFWRGQRPYTVLPFLVIGLTLFVIALWLPSEWLDSTAKFPRLSRTDLLVPVTVCSVIITAQFMHSLGQQYRFAWAIGTLVTVGLSYTILNPPSFSPYPAGNTINIYMESELRGSISGSFRDGHLLPQDTQTLPPPSFPLLASYSLGQVTKIESASRLAGSNLHTLSHSNQHDTLRVNNPLSETTIEILTLNFSGWTATFNGEPITVTNTLTDGFIQMTVPQGSGDLEVALHSTTPRTIGLLVSLGSLVTSLLFIWQWRFQQPPPAQPSVNKLTLGIQVMLAVTILGLQQVNLSQPSHPENRLATPISFENEVTLLGYDLNVSDQFIDLRLYWQANRPNLADYETQVQLIHRETEQTLLTQLHRAPGGWLTSYWIPEKTVQDYYGLSIPLEATPGEYRIEVLVLRCKSSDNPYTCREPQPLISTPSPVILPDHPTIPESR